MLQESCPSAEYEAANESLRKECDWLAQTLQEVQTRLGDEQKRADAADAEVADLRKVLAEARAENAKLLANTILKLTTPPSLPQGMASMKEVTEAMKKRQRREPEKWGMTVKQWRELVHHCKDSQIYKDMKAAKRSVNMYDINEMFVKPWSRGTGCGLGLLMTKDVEKNAELMLSHAWGEDTEELLEALEAYIDEHSIPLSTMLWFCVFANYQPEDTHGPSIADQIKLDPFGTVITNPSLKGIHSGYGMCAIHTTTADLYQRLWCVYEVARAMQEQGVKSAGGMSTKYKNQLIDRLKDFEKRGFGYEECMEAAGVRVHTIAATCGYASDEDMLVRRIKTEIGGYEPLDKTIEAFRREALPGSIFASWIQKGILQYRDANLNARKCPEIAKATFARNGNSLKYAHIDLKKDREIVKVAVAQNGEALQFADEELKKDREIVKVAVAERGNALQFADEELKKDREIVKVAVAENGGSLRFADEELKKDPEVVKVAVAQNGEALQFADEELKKDREIVKVAVAEKYYALQFADEELKKDREFLEWADESACFVRWDDFDNHS